MKTVSIDIVDASTGEVFSKSSEIVHDLNRYFVEKIIQKLRLALRASSQYDVCIQLSIKNVQEELEIF